jgi:hypothetical protein
MDTDYYEKILNSMQQFNEDVGHYSTKKPQQMASACREIKNVMKLDKSLYLVVVTAKQNIHKQIETSSGSRSFRLVENDDDYTY